MNDGSEDRSAESTPARGLLSLLPRWKKGLLGASVVAMLAGLGLQGYGYISRPGQPREIPRGGGVGGLGVRSLIDVRPGDDANAAGQGLPSAEAVEDWYPVLFRLGFSFFAGFCIAYALRTFLKLSIVAIGLVLLVLLGLQYVGVIQVDWGAMKQHYDVAAGWLAGQTASFRQFVTGYLPSSGTAALGLFAGFRRH